MNVQVSGQVCGKLTKLIRVKGAVPEAICSRFGIEDGSVDAFLQVYLHKGRRGRGRMEHAVNEALREVKPVPNPMPLPYCSW